MAKSDTGFRGMSEQEHKDISRKGGEAKAKNKRTDMSTKKIGKTPSTGTKQKAA